MAQAASASASLLAGPEAQEVCARLMGAVGPILAAPVEPGTTGGLNGCTSCLHRHRALITGRLPVRLT